MHSTIRRTLALALSVAFSSFALGGEGCTSGTSPGTETAPSRTGGSPGSSGGAGGNKGSGTGGQETSATGGSSGAGAGGSNNAGGAGPGSGGSPPGSGGAPEEPPGPDASTGDATPTAPDATAPDDSGGGMGQSGSPGVIPPVIPDECPGDLTAGFTEYQDTFKVQKPYDLMATDRYTFIDGIYTIWVKKGDKPHEMGNTTRERTEFRWSDISTGTHLWSGDFKVENDSQHVCIFQVKNSGPPTGVYLRVDQGNLHQLNGGNFLNGIYDKWYSLKVVVDTAAATGKVYINNCLKQTVNMPRGSGTWYFKNGTYTCDSTICKSYWKNIHIYKR